MAPFAQPHGSWQRFVSAFMLLTLLATSLAGCGGSTASAAPAAAPAAQPVQRESQPAAQAPSAAPTRTPTPAPSPTVAAEPAAADPAVTAPSLDDLEPLLKTTNILLLGSDRRPNTPNWRTDVIMIVAVDRPNNRVGVISLPRDLYIDQIPNHRGNKVNVIDYLGEQDAPNGGGPELLGQVIEAKIGVPIHHYVRVDFESVKRLVDAMGGVEVEVDCAIYDPYGYDEGGDALALDVGVHRLTGGEALSYVRSRRIGGDLEREMKK